MNINTNLSIDWELKDNADNKKKVTKKEFKLEIPINSREEIKTETSNPIKETQTEIFVNSMGEQIMAVKTPFGGFQYIKVGKITNSLFSYNKAFTNIEPIK